jgi:ubiquitin carboxyl-terminal hydrolase 5/13
LIYHEQEASDEPPAKMTKLAISAQREEDTYFHVTALKCWACDPVSGLELPDAAPPALVEGVMTSMSSARQSEVQAWEEEITPCEHTLCLEQLAIGPIAPSGSSLSFSHLSALYVLSFVLLRRRG